MYEWRDGYRERELISKRVRSLKLYCFLFTKEELLVSEYIPFRIGSLGQAFSLYSTANLGIRSCSSVAKRTRFASAHTQHIYCSQCRTSEDHLSTIIL